MVVKMRKWSVVRTLPVLGEYSHVSCVTEKLGVREAGPQLAAMSATTVASRERVTGSNRG